MSEKSANEQTPNLIEQLANKRVQIDTRDVFKKLKKTKRVSIIA